MDYLKKYTEIYPDLKKDGIVILFLEGLGGYKGIPYHKDLHPKGRMGAKLVVYKNGILIYESNNASTLPDEICGKAYINNGNDGSSTPTSYAGNVWDVYAKYHLNKIDKRHQALEIGLGSRNIEVIRDEKPSRSSAINIHYRPLSDYTTKQWVTSAGCLTILEEDNYKFLEAIGATINGNLVQVGTHIGKVIIDRSFISNDLQALYKSLYKDMYQYFIGLNLLEVKAMNYKEIIAKYADKEKVNEWIVAIDAIVAMANESTNLGDVEIAKFLPALIEKIGNK